MVLKVPKSKQVSRCYGTVPFISGMLVNEHSTDEGHSPETSGHLFQCKNMSINNTEKQYWKVKIFQFSMLACAFCFCSSVIKFKN